MQIPSTNTLSNRRWLLFLDSATTPNEFFADIFIPFDCEFLVVQTAYGDVEVSVTEVYHVHPTRALQMYRVANWTSGSGLTWSTIAFHHRRRNLQAIVLKGAFIIDVYSAL
jgi:hypothetical protein